MAPTPENPANAPTPPEPPWGAAAGSLSLLVVEPHRATRDALAALLRREGHRVEVAEDPEAVATLLFRPPGAAAAPPFDLVICDPGRVGGTGTAMLERFAAVHILPAAPVLALSGHGAEADVAAGLAEGYRVYLVKPVSAGQLLAGIAAALAPRAAPLHALPMAHATSATDQVHRDEHQTDRHGGGGGEQGPPTGAAHTVGEGVDGDGGRAGHPGEGADRDGG
jgi:DNA-binding response OmpR family regulator